MKFVTVNYHLNQTYSIEDKAILQMVSAAVKDVKGIKIIKSEVLITKDHLSYEIKLEVEKSKTKSYEQASAEITKNIEESSMNLMEFIPENIQINFN